MTGKVKQQASLISPANSPKASLNLKIVYRPIDQLRIPGEVARESAMMSPTIPI
jgi:hypothetical protein